MSVSRNCAVHRVTLSLREREKATSDRRTLMLISASNSKNDVNKFNVSAIVVREERRRGEETSKRQMPQKCCDERTTERTAIGSRMQMKIFTNENAVTVEFEKEERARRAKTAMFAHFFGPRPVILLLFPRTSHPRTRLQPPAVTRTV